MKTKLSAVIFAATITSSIMCMKYDNNNFIIFKQNDPDTGKIATLTMIKGPNETYEGLIKPHPDHYESIIFKRTGLNAKSYIPCFMTTKAGLAVIFTKATRTTLTYVGPNSNNFSVEENPFVSFDALKKIGVYQADIKKIGMPVCDDGVELPKTDVI